MKTVGDKITNFAITGVRPGQPQDAFYTITDQSFEGKWKVIVYYPKDFTFVCPTEIVAYDKLAGDFADRDAVLLTGSTDNEFCKVAWQKSHDDLRKITHHQFADTQRGELSLIEQLGVFYAPAGAALRATFQLARAAFRRRPGLAVRCRPPQSHPSKALSIQWDNWRGGLQT